MDEERSPSGSVGAVKGTGGVRSTPVNIIAGFLGAGKTTLIRAQLEARRGEKLAVIVNDFGEASLDEATLKSGAPFQLTSIPGGCLCCTAPEGFVTALDAVLETAPDRLLIEPTGLARPQDLVDTIRRCPQRERLALAPVLVLVDPARLDRLRPEERELVEHAAGVADVLIASRSDLCDAAALRRFDAFAKTLWPGPLAIHHCSQGQVPPSLLDWPEGADRKARQERLREHANAHQPNAAFQARSFHWPAHLVFSGERLRRALQQMQDELDAAGLTRIKGIFRTREGFELMELAGGKLQAQRSAHRRDSRADVILECAEGEQADARFRRIAADFERALLTERERAESAEQIEVVLPDGRVRVLRREDLAALPDGVADITTLFPKRKGSAARVAALWSALQLPAAGSAVVCAEDGFASEPVPLRALRQGFLLHSEGKAALPRERGGPFRLLLPESAQGAAASCANVKGVVRVVLRDG